MHRTFISRAHPPVAFHLAVPIHRKLHQFTFARAVQIGLRVAARTDHIVDRHLLFVRLFAVEPNLVALLEQSSIVRPHGVIAFSVGVEDCAGLLCIVVTIAIAHTVKRLPHAGLPIACRNAGVAASTGCGISVFRVMFLCVYLGNAEASQLEAYTDAKQCCAKEYIAHPPPSQTQPCVLHTITIPSRPITEILLGQNVVMPKPQLRASGRTTRDPQSDRQAQKEIRHNIANCYELLEANSTLNIEEARIGSGGAIRRHLTEL
jgi:hypothetical protein